jgi:hypothetical protein
VRSNAPGYLGENAVNQVTLVDNIGRLLGFTGKRDYDLVAIAGSEKPDESAIWQTLRTRGYLLIVSSPNWRIATSHLPSWCVGLVGSQKSPITPQRVRALTERLTWPIRIGTADCLDVKEGFNGDEGNHRWTTNLATIDVPIPKDLTPKQTVVLQLEGGLAKPPLILSVNGSKIGRPIGDVASIQWTIPAGVLRPGQFNEIRLEIPNAGPIGRDTRILGYRFRGIKLFPGIAR